MQEDKAAFDLIAFPSEVLVKGKILWYLLAETANRDPQDARRRLYEFAASQGGYFTATQAREAGYPKQLQHYHARRGNWVREDRGIYRIWEWSGSSYDDLIRWTLWSGRAGVVSHDSAMAVHEISDLMPARVHMTVPPTFRKRSPPGLFLYRDTLDPHEVEQREGFRVTTPLRTIIDGARVAVDPKQLARGICDAIRKGLLGDRHIEGAIETLSRPAADRLHQALMEARRAA